MLICEPRHTLTLVECASDGVMKPDWLQVPFCKMSPVEARDLVWSVMKHLQPGELHQITDKLLLATLSQIFTKAQASLRDQAAADQDFSMPADSSQQTRDHTERKHRKHKKHHKKHRRHSLSPGKRKMTAYEKYAYEKHQELKRLHQQQT